MHEHFDESFFPGIENMDLEQRMRTLGRIAMQSQVIIEVITVCEICENRERERQLTMVKYDITFRWWRKLIEAITSFGPLKPLHTARTIKAIIADARGWLHKQVNDNWKRVLIALSMILCVTTGGSAVAIWYALTTIEPTGKKLLLAASMISAAMSMAFAIFSGQQKLESLYHRDAHRHHDESVSKKYCKNLGIWATVLLTFSTALAFAAAILA